MIGDHLFSRVTDSTIWIIVDTGNSIIVLKMSLRFVFKIYPYTHIKESDVSLSQVDVTMTGPFNF